MGCKIDPTKCLGCHSCAAVCPVGAISIDENGKCKIDSTKCISCGTCAAVCPALAISKE